jgi:hypothetical protein
MLIVSDFLIVFKIDKYIGEFFRFEKMIKLEKYIPKILNILCQACVMQMSSGRMACDYKYATNSYDDLDFYVDMNYARYY